MTKFTQHYIDAMRRGWQGGVKDGTVCGRGSTLKNTEGAREWLPKISEKYQLQTVCDAGAGDLHWIKEVKWPVEYRAFDLIPRNERVEEWDITERALPACDLILCRFVLSHMPKWAVLQAVQLFKKSGKYLAATQYDGRTVENETAFNTWDLRLEPFSLGNHLETLPEGVAGSKGCVLALWKL